MKARILYITALTAAIVTAHCWAFAPKPEMLKPLRGGISVQYERPKFQFAIFGRGCRQSKDDLIVRCPTDRDVMLLARIKGSIEWCPTEIIWYFGLRPLDDRKTSDQYVTRVNCNERVWNQTKFYTYGTYTLTARIVSRTDGVDVVGEPIVLKIGE